MEKRSHPISQTGNYNCHHAKSDPTKNSSGISINSDRYAEFFTRTADAILILDQDTFVDCNQATVDMLRYSTKEEMLQTHPSELSPEFQPDGQSSYEKANEMINLAFAQGNHRFEWTHLRADGSSFPVEVLLTPISLDDRMVLHVVWRDITDRKRLEFEFLHAQKIEAVGLLTGGIAHDFNNYLMAIFGYSEFLVDELPEDSPGLDYIEKIQLASNKATALVKQLLAFSRKQLLQPKVLELNELLRSIEDFWDPVLGADIQFISRYSNEPLPVLADSSQLEQVVINLVTNARDAMNGSGSLILETFLVNLPEPQTSNGKPLAPGIFAMLSVKDNGEGISDGNLDRIFDPFFTTKDVGKGTGLGLSTAHGIIKQSGGEITVSSKLGQGTEFKVYLPLSKEAPAALEVGQRPAINHNNQTTETILVVEDDMAVSHVVKTILCRAGYEVFSATNGLQALAIVDSLNLKPHLLLTDVVMPEMGGPELAQKLKAQLPTMKVLFASGFPNNALKHQDRLAEGVELIEKPFTPVNLLKRLREILDSQRTLTNQTTHVRK